MAAKAVMPYGVSGLLRAFCRKEADVRMWKHLSGFPCTSPRLQRIIEETFFIEYIAIDRMVCFSAPYRAQVFWLSGLYVNVAIGLKTSQAENREPAQDMGGRLARMGKSKQEESEKKVWSEASYKTHPAGWARNGLSGPLHWYVRYWG